MYEKDAVRYLCYHRSRKLCECDGAATYKAQVIDDYVIEAMNAIFPNIKGCPHEEKIQSAYRKMIANNKQLQRKRSDQLEKDTRQLENLRMEIANALAGTSIYSSEDLARAIQTIRGRIAEAEKQLKELQREEYEKKATSESIIPAYNRFKTWADTFASLPLENKKMIASQLFSRIEIGKINQIHLEMDTTYQAFCDEWLTPKNGIATA